jgi:hypothetical protein
MDRIPGIVPYNKCFYYNCFHSDLFPIIEANSGNIFLFLANGIPYFQIQTAEAGKRLLTRFVFRSDYPELLVRQGISVRRFDGKFDWKQAMVCALKNEEPVILGVDCWHLDYREDLYHKIHWPHTLLIFGADQSRGVYLAVDQPTREVMHFLEYEVASHVLENAHEGFCNQKEYDPLFSSDKMLMFHLEQKPERCTTEDVAVFWRKNRRVQRTKVLQGLCEAAEFEPILIDCLNVPSRCADANDFILDGLNDIVKQKRWEAFFVENLPPLYRDCEQKAKELLSHWATIRNLAGYIFLSGSPREEIVRRIGEEYETVLKAEREYFALAGSEV